MNKDMLFKELVDENNALRQSVIELNLIINNLKDDIQIYEDNYEVKD